MRFIQKSKLRSLLLATAAVAALASVGAGSASAASALQVTTDSNQVRSLTSVKITTKLTGSGTALKQYGAQITMPKGLPLTYYYFGGTSDMCSPANFGTTSTGLGTVQTFTNSGCPAGARIGTATIGNISGGIYTSGTSPLPSIGVYFDTGTASPFGRKLNTTWTDGVLAMSILGLPNTSSTGLTLDFYNPNRGGTLSSKVFSWAEPGDSGCVKNPQVTGATNHWPSVVIPGLSTYSTTTATPATLTLNGCDFDFLTGQNTTAAGAEVGLSTLAGVYGAGAKQYGQTFDLPASIWNNFPGWSVGSCSPTSYTTISTGLTPAAGGFTPTGCTAASKVGTATLGGQSGYIYIVDQSPMDMFGVYFDQGVTTPYGRRLTIDWGATGSGRPQLRIFGLNGAANAGLRLNWTPPAAGQPKIFNLAPAGSAECATDYAKSTIYTYPASGTAATATGPLTARNPIQITGCTS